MRIDAIDLFLVRMPLIEPWRTAYGEDAAVESVLVQLHSGKLSAWGEACPLAAPCYSPEFARGVFTCVREWFAPAIVGQSIDSGEALQARLAHFKGNPFAKAALDVAWWVLEARRQERPLHALFGAARNYTDIGDDFGVLDSVDDLLGRIGRAVEQKFPRVKLKFRPGWDLPMLRAVRKEFPTTVFHIDCNSGYRLSDLDLFRQVDELSLAMIEQPLSHDDVLDHAELQRAIRTPVCLDESIASVARTEQALRLGSCQWVNIKPARVGGITPALRVHELCKQAGVGCWIGGMLESAIGARVCLALAMLDNCKYPADIFATSRYYARELGDRPIEISTGPQGTPVVYAEDLPGVGCEPLPDRLAEYALAHARLEA